MSDVATKEKLMEASPLNAEQMDAFFEWLSDGLKQRGLSEDERWKAIGIRVEREHELRKLADRLMRSHWPSEDVHEHVYHVRDAIDGDDSSSRTAMRQLGQHYARRGSTAVDG